MNDENNEVSIYPNYLFKKLILPLIGYTNQEIEKCLESLQYCDSKNIEEEIKKIPNYRTNCYRKSNYELIFYLLSNKKKEYYKIKLLKNSPKEDIDLICCILEVFNNYGNYGEDRNARDNTIQETINNLIVQKGLFNYFFNLKKPNNNINKLYKCLNNWSLKTYEGHKVCYGFLVDIDENSKDSDDSLDSICGDFIDFISEEYSAVFTDVISSIAEINNDGKFIKFHSLTENNKIESIDDMSETNLPIRITQMIKKYVVNSKIGWFLLNNGDMIIAKKGEIKFIKRSSKWLNFSKETFCNKINFYLNDKRISKLLNSIYSTVLDISFAHSGGIIAVVNDDDDDTKWGKAIAIDNENPLVSQIDLFNNIDCSHSNYIYDHISNLYENEISKINSQYESNETSDQSINDEYFKKEAIKDLKKRLNKKRFLLEILNKENKFQNVDRKLRAELSGLDGAIIINFEGEILGCGAIIANTAGSSGGGRGSAARTLSNYGGFAIKISTDGYVEIFHKGARIYSIK